MFKHTKTFALVLAICMLLSTFVACSGNTNTSSTEQPASSQAATESTPESEEVVEPAKITMFMSDSGVGVPDGVDPKDNPYINKIEELANVEITEMTVPAYGDFQTQLQLLLSTSDLPDVIHSWDLTELDKAGKAGAFVTWDDIYASSEKLQEMYTEQQLDLMRSDDGEIYAFRGWSSQDYMALAVRQDILDEVNGGVIPTTPDEWYEVYKKIKEAYPDSVPLSSSNGADTTTVAYFEAFGAKYGGWQYQDGKYISAIEAPHHDEAVLFMKKLYDEGLLSKTFVTNTFEDFNNDYCNKNMVMRANNLASCMACVTLFVDPAYYSGDPTEPRIVIAPWPKAEYDDIEPTLGRGYSSVSSHAVAVSAKTEELEGCVRLVEAFVSEDATTIATWGLEDVEFTGTGDARVLTDAAAENSYRLMYNFMRWGSSEQLSYSMQGYFANVDESIKDDYKAELLASVADTTAVVEEYPTVKPDELIVIGDDTVKALESEAYERYNAMVMKAITGEISMDEYATQKAQYLQDYQTVTDAYNAAWDAVKGDYDF